MLARDEKVSYRRRVSPALGRMYGVCSTHWLIRVEVSSNMLMAALVFGAVTLNELLSVETGSPDALCPALKETTEAIHARLGTLKSEQPGWRARYTLGHAPDSGQGDFIRLELFDPRQQLQLLRELPVGQASCSTLAQSIAIVVSGYFASLAPADDDEPVRAAADPVTKVHPDRRRVNDSLAPLQGVGVARASETPVQRPPADTATEPSRGTPLVFGAGFSLPFASYGRGLGLSCAGSLNQATGYGVLLTLPLERTSTPVDIGRVYMWSARARFWYGLRAAVGPVAGSIGPSLSLGLDSAYARGLDEPKRQQRMVVAIGLLLDATYWIYSALGLGLQAGMDLGDKLTSRRFVVLSPHAEPEQAVHAPRWVNGFVGASLKISLPN